MTEDKPVKDPNEKILRKLASVEADTIAQFSKLDKADFEELLRRKGRLKAGGQGPRLREILLWQIDLATLREMAKSKGVAVADDASKAQVIDSVLTTAHKPPPRTRRRESDY